MKLFIPLLLVFLSAMRTCVGPNGDNSSPAQERAVAHHELKSAYYWKTVFNFDSTHRSIIDRQHIGRIYLRMFDVAAVNGLAQYDSDERTYPNATVQIEQRGNLLRDSCPHLEFIPTVFITLDALKAMRGRESELAEKIVTRVGNMVQYNDLPNVYELQLDCDWTTSTESSFFTLCQAAGDLLKARPQPWRLSCTIRLHQLSRPVPPVDRGVLMVYNTGSFNNPDTRNSIIDIDDIRPYMRRLSGYGLHLDVAYPTYSWQLLYRNRTFAGLTRSLDLTDTARFTPRGVNVYVARRDVPHNGKIIRSGDMVRAEESDYAEIMAVRNLIEQELADKPHSNIIYHLDPKNLSKYTKYEIDNILSVGR